MPNLKRRSPVRSVSIRTGQTYGIGSLLHQPRTVIALADGGTNVTYEVGQPPALSEDATRPREPGRKFTCSRRAFVLWLAKVREETQQIHGRVV